MIKILLCIDLSHRTKLLRLFEGVWLREQNMRLGKREGMW